MINITKKPKNKSNNIKLNDYELYKSEDNKRTLNKKQRNAYAEKNRIYMTEDSYIMNNRYGKQLSVSIQDLKKINCLQNEKLKIEKQFEEKEDYLSRLLKSQLIQEQKMLKIKEKMEQKEKRYQKFLKERSDGIKYMENERYQDHIDIHERQKIYEKMLYNFDKKLNVVKKSNSQVNKMNKENNKDSQNQDNLKEQIKDYEKKSERYRQKITEMCDLKNIYLEPKKTEPTIKKNDIINSSFGRKMIEMEEKYEINKMRRESALMSHISQYQKKINLFLEKKDEKEKKIKKLMKSLEKRREEKRMIKNIRFDEIREKVKDNQKRIEEERIKKLEDIEKKDLKDFAIRQEKIKLYEERKKINQQNYEEKEIMKAKLNQVLKKKKNIKNIEDDNFISNIMNQ